MCADRAARRLKMYVEPHPADWKRHGRAAGPIRNAEMLDAPGGIHYLHCFKDNFDNLLRKGGSENMVKQAMSRRISVKLHNHG